MEKSPCSLILAVISHHSSKQHHSEGLFGLPCNMSMTQSTKEQSYLPLLEELLLLFCFPKHIHLAQVNFNLQTAVSFQKSVTHTCT